MILFICIVYILCGLIVICKTDLDKNIWVTELFYPVIFMSLLILWGIVKLMECRNKNNKEEDEYEEDEDNSYI